MEILVTIIIGTLFAAAVFSLLRRSLVKLVIGIILLGQAVNLVVFSAGGLGNSNPPVITPDEKTLVGITADPLPQALVLTAIVIGFGLVSYLLALVMRTFSDLESEDINNLRRTES